METRDFSLKIKTLSDEGTFEGLAAVYGVEDLTGDVIEAGAFKRTMDQQGDGFPLLWCHDQAQPLGLARLSDSPRGPIVHGTIDLGDPDGERAHRRVKRGVVKGLSIGFTVPNPATVTYDGEGVRHLREIRLHEISLVAIPAQTGAQVFEVRSLGDAARLLDRWPVDRLGGAELNALRSIGAHTKRLLGAAGPGEDAALLAELRDLAALLR